MVSECPHALFILTGTIKNLFWNKTKGMEDNSNIFPLLTILTLEILQKALEVFMF